MDLTTAVNGADGGPEVTLAIPSNALFARAALGFPDARARQRSFTGSVLVDSTRQRLVDAEVSLPDLGRTTTTDAMGSFRLSALPPGTHRVLIRRLGFSPAEFQVTLGDADSVNRQILLRPTVVLDAVRVVGAAVDRAMQSFEDHRRTGLGHFLTRADLANSREVSMSGVLEPISGLHLLRGRSGRAWVAGGRGPQSIAWTSLPGGDGADAFAGAPRACYARVYVNRQLVYSGRQGEPLFDVNSVRPDELEAVEYYAGPSETPGEYTDLDATRGVLVLRTKRSP